VHPDATLFVCHLVVQPQNIEIENTVKFAVFRHTRATVYTDQPKIWCERVHQGFILACQIWPWWV